MIPLRYVMIFLVVSSVFGIMMSNMCVSLALQAMTPKKIEVNATHDEVCDLPDDFIEKNNQHIINSNTSNESDRLRDKVFHWSQSTQSIIFASVFITNVLFKTAAGFVVQRFGGKWILTGCLFGMCIISFIIPWAAEHVWLLICCRLMMGFLYSGCMPSSYDIIVKWVPLHERSMCFSLLEVGQNLATITTFVTSGIIYEEWGWPALFYLPGTASGTVGILVLLGLRSQPREVYDDETELNEFKPEEKAEFQQQERGRRLSVCLPEEPMKADREQMLSVATPIRQIITNRAVLAATLFRFTTYFNTMLMASKVPAYLKDIQHEDIKTNGYTNATMSAVGLVSLLINGYLSDFLINKRYFRRTTVRKMAAGIAGFGISTSIMCIPAAGCNTMPLHIILFCQAFAEGFSGNLQALPSEMTKFFPAVTYSLMATMSASGGFVAPSYAGIILDQVNNQWMAYNIIWWSTGCVMILATINFLINASAERQPFDFVEDQIPKKGKDGSLRSTC